MIYIETKNQKFGLMVDVPESLGELVELCIADRISNHIEKNYQTFKNSFGFDKPIEKIDKIEMRFQNCDIYSGTLGDVNTPGHSILIMLLFNFFTIFGKINGETLFSGEFHQFEPVEFRLNELGFVTIKTDNFNVYITD